jgi:hypothetical protein
MDLPSPTESPQEKVNAIEEEEFKEKLQQEKKTDIQERAGKVEDLTKLLNDESGNQVNKSDQNENTLKYPNLSHDASREQ